MSFRTVTLVSCGGEYEAWLTDADERPLCVLTVTLCTHTVILAFVNIWDTHTRKVCSVTFLLLCFV